MSVSVNVDDELKYRIDKLALRQQRSSESLMQKALQDYVAREEKREAFQQEAIASLQEYKQTGLHLTGDEVSHWLSTWGTEQETVIPTCHK